MIWNMVDIKTAVRELQYAVPAMLSIILIQWIHIEDLNWERMTSVDKRISIGFSLIELALF